MSTSAVLLVLLGSLYLLYQRLLPKPLAGIPYDPVSARKLLGDGPDMLREIRKTKAIHEFLLKKVNKLQEPVCQVFVEPFSKPWVLLADSVESQNLLSRRPEFDRSSFDKMGLAPLDGYHSRATMGESWRTTRSWLQDLISPNFLNNIVSPAMYDNTLHMVRFWETKARLANGRPFDVTHDIDHVVLDGMLSFIFDKQYEHDALNPQIQAVAQLDPSTLEIGPNGEAKFPHAAFNTFTGGLYGIIDAIDFITSSPWPQLVSKYVRYIPKFGKAIATKKRIIKEQVQAAGRRLETKTEATTALESMLLREKKMAEKQGRKPDLENQTMMDEVSWKNFFTTTSS